jgi:dolichol kinase
MTKPVLGTVAVLIAAAAAILYFTADSDPETSAVTARQSEAASTM